MKAGEAWLQNWSHLLLLPSAPPLILPCFFCRRLHSSVLMNGGIFVIHWVWGFFSPYFFFTLTRNNLLLPFTILQFGNSLLYMGPWLFLFPRRKWRETELEYPSASSSTSIGALGHLDSITEGLAAKGIHHVHVCYSSAARMPYTFQNTTEPA